MLALKSVSNHGPTSRLQENAGELSARLIDFLAFSPDIPLQRPFLAI
jgi:hypothetical protein